VALGRSQPASAPRSILAEAAVAAATPRDPDNAVRALLEEWRRLPETDRGREDALRCELLGWLDRSDASALLVTFAPEDACSEFGVSVLARWAAQDAVQAGRWLASQSAPTDEQVHALATGFAHQPAGLDRFCSEQPGVAWRDDLLAQTALLEQNDEPALAAKHVDRMADGPARERALLSLSDDWARRDPAAAAAWMSSLPAGAARDRLVAHAAAGRASADPMTAVDWALGVRGTDATLGSAVRAVLATWRSYAPAEAGRFAAQIESALPPP
jgi:hypothetical protein